MQNTLYAGAALAVIVLSIIGLHLFQSPTTHMVIFKNVPGAQQIDSAAGTTYWEKRISVVGGASAYKELAQSVENLTPVKQHIAAHRFGGALYQVEGVRGLGVCGNEFGQGCLHQFFGSAIQDNGLAEGTAKFAIMCANQEKVTDRQTCEHGLGHGVLGFLGYSVDDLVATLLVCEKDVNGTDFTLGCSGGAFMEYNLRELLKTDDVASPPRTLATSTIDTPCDQIPHKYQASCIFWQPVWWYISLSKSKDLTKDFLEVAHICKSLSPASLARVCFEGIGYEASRVAPDASATAEICANVSMVANDRISCWSFGTVQFPKDEWTAAAHLVCKGLKSAARVYCDAHDQDRVDLSSIQVSPDI